MQDVARPQQHAVRDAERQQGAEAAQTAGEGDAAAEATAADPAAETTTDAATPAETSLEEAAAQAQDVQVEQGKPFDPTKASRKELDEFNADREPDQKIKCVQTYPTGSRRPTKVCMSQAQWRQWNKANQ